MRVEDLTVGDVALHVVGLDLHHIQRSRRLALPTDVDQDQRVVAAHDLVGEVEPAGAEVDDVHAVWQLVLAQALGDLAAEAVVAQPGVADAGNEDLLGASCGLGHAVITSSGKKNR